MNSQTSILFTTCTGNATAIPISSGDNIDNLIKKYCEKLQISQSEIGVNIFFLFGGKKIKYGKGESLDILKMNCYSPILVIEKNTIEANNKEAKAMENSINNNQVKKRNRFQTKIDKALEEETIKDTMKDMAVIGSIKKSKIYFEPEKYFTIQEALNSPDEQIRALGLLSYNLSTFGIVSVIDKEEAVNETEKVEIQIAANNLLQFLVNGLIFKKKYYLNFNLKMEKINQLNTNPTQRAVFIDKLKVKLMNYFHLSKEELIVAYYPQIGTFNIIVVFKKEGVNNFNYDELVNKAKFKYDAEFKFLTNINEAYLIDGIILNKAMLDSRGDNKDGGWGYNETRGGQDYIPPEGWIRYGVNVFNQYDSGNNDWLSYDNRQGEWAIGYHEISRSDNKNPNVLFENDNDLKNQGHRVGRGTYCTQYPVFMEEYASIIQVNGKKYQMGFMLRLKPEKIRQPSSQDEYWVVNGTPDEIRPYGLLVKEIE